MPFAYITRPGATLKKSGRTLLLHDHGEPIQRFGLGQLEALILRGTVHLTTPALRALLANNIPTTFLATNGRLLGHLVPPRDGNAPLRLQQYRLAFDEATKLAFARQTVRDKLDAQDDLLTRYAVNYPSPELRQARRKIQDAGKSLAEVQSIETLLGVEGSATKVYWSAFQTLNRGALGFHGRSRRPPRDEVNALLSLGYVILTNELRALLEAAGLDPFLGYYHTPKANRPSLPLDLVEPLRHSLIDRFILRSTNLGRFKPDHFEGDEAKGFRLTTAGWKILLADYEDALLANPSGPLADQFPHARSWRELLRTLCRDFARRLLQTELQSNSSTSIHHHETQTAPQ